MNKQELKAKLKENPGYLKSGSKTVSRLFGVSKQIAYETIREVKEELDIPISRPKVLFENNTDKQLNKITRLTATEDHSLFEEFIEWRKNKKLKTNIVTKEEKILPKPYTTGNPSNVLVIGDLHEPFCLDGYLEFCREKQEEFNCGTIVFIGDIVDGNSWSFHDKEFEVKGIETEIEEAKEKLSNWFYTFPEAKVTLGNHDLLIIRKAMKAGLSTKFLKNFGDVWGAPSTWTFDHEFIINNVKYTHGSVGNAIKVAKESRISTIQGHLHTQAFVDWSVSEKDRIFGCQVGCGIDHKSFAFNYSKPFAKKPVIGCAVVLNKGELPINLLMKL